ncbi:MAG: transposase [Nitrospinota bacterium]
MSELFANKYRIKTSRYKGWDYSKSGFYFVTICTKNFKHHFGNVETLRCNVSVPDIRLSIIGEIVKEEWLKTPVVRKNVDLDEWIIMPNHMHGIIAMGGKPNSKDVALSVPAEKKRTKFAGISPKSNSLSEVIRSFKSTCTRKINKLFPKNNFAWQPRFHDRIIRNEDELNRIREYIRNNPLNWEVDCKQPESLEFKT